MKYCEDVATILDRVPREREGRESFRDICGHERNVGCHESELHEKGRECNFWVKEDVGKAGSVVYGSVFLPRRRIFDRDSRVSVVDSVGGNESAHASMKFSLLDFKDGRGIR